MSCILLEVHTSRGALSARVASGGATLPLKLCVQRVIVSWNARVEQRVPRVTHRFLCLKDVSPRFGLACRVIESRCMP